MRKLVAGLVAGIIMLAATVTTVSAEEYEVQAGDSLWDIANENNTSIDDLIDLNDLKTTVIHPKQILLLNETYIVESGDSLISIAKQYDVTVEDLKEWNNLKSDVIINGQELNIKEVSNKKDAQVESKKVEKEVKKEVQKEEKTVQASASNDKPEGKTITVKATAYTAKCEGCSGITYTGVDLNSNPDAKVIAVDPNVIPLGSKVYVEGYGQAVAADIGSAIKGNRIDVFIPNLDKAKEWGTRTLNITIL
ncbi:3D domain-containing protein [Oceanobacillus sp. Castelsardo]|uniref:3D domain-containing protein n=1 Tax=Oceanobacillus sp. Castelsardo TaxID=1851204 RepID=UPI0008393C30|nr:3D domain-containing protein [Oceanobacillus sp. Castelsardo]